MVWTGPFYEFNSDKLSMVVLWQRILVAASRRTLGKSSDRRTITVKFSGGQGLEFKGLAREHTDHSSIKISTCVQILRCSKVKVFRPEHGVLRHTGMEVTSASMFHMRYYVSYSSARKTLNSLQEALYPCSTL